MKATLLSSLILVLALPSWAAADAAREAFDQGEKQLAQGELQAALASFATAARTDRSQADYMQHYALVRRAIELRTRLAAERDPQQWNYLARALRSFYHAERLRTEALALEEQIHGREQSPASAVMLAETQLSLNRNARAAETLASVPASPATARAQALRGVALVRLGQADEAAQAAQTVELPADADVNTLYAAARMHAALGQRGEAASLLVRCFEGVLPSQAEGFRAHARACPEFAAMASTPEFAQALATVSKMSESKCSGGSSCAGCPMRSGCPRSAAQ